MEEKPTNGYPIIGTIKAVKGTCSAGHQVGDQIELSAHLAGGMCGFFYHDVLHWPFQEKKIYKKWLIESEWGNLFEAYRRRGTLKK